MYFSSPAEFLCVCCWRVHRSGVTGPLYRTLSHSPSADQKRPRDEIAGLTQLVSDCTIEFLRRLFPAADGRPMFDRARRLAGRAGTSFGARAKVTCTAQQWQTIQAVVDRRGRLQLATRGPDGTMPVLAHARLCRGGRQRRRRRRGDPPVHIAADSPALRLCGPGAG